MDDAVAQKSEIALHIHRLSLRGDGLEVFMTKQPGDKIKKYGNISPCFPLYNLQVIWMKNYSIYQPIQVRLSN